MPPRKKAVKKANPPVKKASKPAKKSTPPTKGRKSAAKPSSQPTSGKRGPASGTRSKGKKGKSKSDSDEDDQSSKSDGEELSDRERSDGEAGGESPESSEEDQIEEHVEKEIILVSEPEEESEDEEGVLGLPQRRNKDNRKSGKSSPSISVELDNLKGLVHDQGRELAKLREQNKALNNSLNMVASRSSAPVVPPSTPYDVRRSNDLDVRITTLPAGLPDFIERDCLRRPQILSLDSEMLKQKRKESLPTLHKKSDNLALEQWL